MVGDVLVVVIVQLQVVILEFVRSISIISSSYFQFTNPKSYHINCVRFLARCRISMCQGLGPKKHYDISETDRRSGIPLARTLGASPI